MGEVDAISPSDTEVLFLNGGILKGPLTIAIREVGRIHRPNFIQ